MTKTCSLKEDNNSGFVLSMGRQEVEEEVAKMLKEVRKVAEVGEEMKVEEEARGSNGMPKPSFLANLMAIQQLHGKPECPPPRRKKAKKTVRFLISTVSKRKLQMEEEEEMDMLSLKRVKKEMLLEEELEQIGFMMTNLAPNGKT